MSMTLAKDAMCIKATLVTGTTVAADTTNPGSMTVTGIGTEDTIIYAESRIIYDTTVDQVTDISSTISITAANTITSTSNTSTNGAGGILVTDTGKVWVLWQDNDA